MSYHSEFSILCGQNRQDEGSYSTHCKGKVGVVDDCFLLVGHREYRIEAWPEHPEKESALETKISNNHYLL